LSAKAFDVHDPTVTPGGAGEIGNAMASFQTSGVTTIVIFTQFGATLVAMQAADSSGYKPEWVEMGNYGIDFNFVAGKTLPQTQMTQMFGLSGIELPKPDAQKECWAAYKSIDPNNDPDSSVCNLLFREIQQIVIGIQEAGPHLTPQTFEEGLYKYGRVYPPEPWGIDGGYAPGDHSWTDRMGEVYWDAAAIDPEQNRPGAYMWTNNAARYGPGEMPSGQPDFSHGIQHG